VLDPNLIRAEQRMKAGLFTLHGVDLAPVSRTVEIGRRLAAYRARITAKAFEASRRRQQRGENRRRESLPTTIANSATGRPAG
jgi:hypothetical protein